MKSLLSLMIVLAVSAGALPALGADKPWEAPGWSRRAVVVVADNVGATAGADAAAVRIFHAGLAGANGNDYRVFDSGGIPVPYLLAAHDAKRDSLILFRCYRPGSTYTIYFGKPDAPVDGQRAVLDPRPGGGPPRPGPDAGGWTPRAGLVLQTWRRPHDVPNPMTVAELASLLAHCDGPDGAGYRTNISDGFNPFGNSEDYMSVYRGWMNIPDSGNWGFCTDSNESSFSFLDGQTLVDWPGQHTEARGRRGQMHAMRQLTKGLHYVEYYQENQEGSQMAFLGWHPPNAKPDYYYKVPETVFVQPMWGRVQRYERAPGEAAATVAPELLDSVWPRGGDRGQYTRYRLSAELPPDEAARWRLTWDFGDGQTSASPTVEHVFLHVGRFNVKLSATGPAGQKMELAWPLVVFSVEYLADSFRNGSARVLGKIAADYNRGKLSTADAANLARLAENAGDQPTMRAAADEAAGRADAEPLDLLEMQSMLTAGFLAGGPQADAFARQLRAAMTRTSDATLTVRLLARLIPLVGIPQGRADEAQKLYAQAETAAKQGEMRRPAREALRDATIAIGDVKLVSHQTDAALEDYRVAERLAANPMPPEVREAKSGAYPEAIEQHLAAAERQKWPASQGELAQARELIERWMDESPSAKVGGAPLFYLGKVLVEQQEPGPAVRPLRAAVEVAPGSEFEAEARWLLAEAQTQSGDAAGAKATLQALVRSGLAGQWMDKAKAELTLGAEKK